MSTSDVDCPYEDDFDSCRTSSPKSSPFHQPKKSSLNLSSSVEKPFEFLFEESPFALKTPNKDAIAALEEEQKEILRAIKQAQQKTKQIQKISQVRSVSPRICSNKQLRRVSSYKKDHMRLQAKIGKILSVETVPNMVRNNLEKVDRLRTLEKLNQKIKKRLRHKETLKEGQPVSLLNQLQAEHTLYTFKIKRLEEHFVRRYEEHVRLQQSTRKLMSELEQLEDYVEERSRRGIPYRGAEHAFRHLQNLVAQYESMRNQFRVAELSAHAEAAGVLKQEDRMALRVEIKERERAGLQGKLEELCKKYRQRDVESLLSKLNSIPVAKIMRSQSPVLARANLPRAAKSPEYRRLNSPKPRETRKPREPKAKKPLKLRQQSQQTQTQRRPELDIVSLPAEEAKQVLRGNIESSAEKRPSAIQSIISPPAEEAKQVLRGNIESSAERRPFAIQSNVTLPAEEARPVLKGNLENSAERRPFAIQSIVSPPAEESRPVLRGNIENSAERRPFAFQRIVRVWSPKRDQPPSDIAGKFGLEVRSDLSDSEDEVRLQQTKEDDSVDRAYDSPSYSGDSDKEGLVKAGIEKLEEEKKPQGGSKRDRTHLLHELSEKFVFYRANQGRAPVRKEGRANQFVMLGGKDELVVEDLED